MIDERFESDASNLGFITEPCVSPHEAETWPPNESTLIDDLSERVDGDHWNRLGDIISALPDCVPNFP